jgi:hypothetical protein
VAGRLALLGRSWWTGVWCGKCEASARHVESVCRNWQNKSWIVAKERRLRWSSQWILGYLGGERAWGKSGRQVTGRIRKGLTGGQRAICNPTTAASDEVTCTSEAAMQFAKNVQYTSVKGAAFNVLGEGA